MYVDISARLSFIYVICRWQYPRASPKWRKKKMTCRRQLPLLHQEPHLEGDQALRLLPPLLVLKMAPLPLLHQELHLEDDQAWRILPPFLILKRTSLPPLHQEPHLEDDPVSRFHSSLMAPMMLLHLPPHHRLLPLEPHQLAEGAPV